jgi:hypothetical protein
MRGKPIVVAGWINALGVAVAKALPTRLTQKVAKRINAAGRT